MEEGCGGGEGVESIGGLGAGWSNRPSFPLVRGAGEWGGWWVHMEEMPWGEEGKRSVVALEGELDELPIQKKSSQQLFFICRGLDPLPGGSLRTNMIGTGGRVFFFSTPLLK